MGDAASNNCSQYVVSDMFSGDNFLQHYVEIQSTFYWTLSYPLFSEAYNGVEEVFTRHQISVTVALLFIHDPKILNIYSCFPTQVNLEPLCFATSDQPKTNPENK